MQNTVVIIPARLGSSRLPNKPLALIGDKEMILHVAQKGLSANVGDVIIACSEKPVFDIVENAGFCAIMTDPDLPSGSDRIFAASQQLKKQYQYIVNLQGDMPNIDPTLIIKLVDLIQKTDADIVTAVAPIISPDENANPNVVKAVLAENGRALYFTRSPSVPFGDGPLYHHIGIYVYKTEALKRFVSLPPSQLELREKLEQLRALENGMSIFAAIVDHAPKGVDTIEDLEFLRSELESK